MAENSTNDETADATSQTKRAESSASSNPADSHAYQPLFEDVAFYTRRTKGRWKVVCPPILSPDVAIADSHTHVQSLRNPALSLARCALLGVGTVCDITDVTDDDADVYDRLEAWRSEAADIAHRIVDALRSGRPVAQAEDPDATEATGRDVRLMQTNPGMHESLEKLRQAVVRRAERFEAAGKPIAPTVVFASGCHPQLADRYSDEVEACLRARLEDARTKMLGEIGLDFSYPDPAPDTQIEVFRRQIRLAKEFDMPVSLHIRDDFDQGSIDDEHSSHAHAKAHDMAFRIMDEEGFDFSRAVLHCCNLPADELRPWVARGANVGYGGVLTFGKADDVRDGAATVPERQLLVETDAPYMAPTPLRGNENAPEYSLFAAERLAEVVGCANQAAKDSFMNRLSVNESRLLDMSAHTTDESMPSTPNPSTSTSISTPLSSSSSSSVSSSDVMVLCGSPFPGGTCAGIADGLQRIFASKGMIVNRIDVFSYNVHPCIGCNRCATTHECFMHDDADKVIETLQRTKALVIVAPVYFGGPPSQLKAIFDRFQPLFWTHENGHLDKPCVLLAVGSGGDPYGRRALDICVASAVSMLQFGLVHVQSCTHEPVRTSVQTFVDEGGLQMVESGKEHR